MRWRWRSRRTPAMLCVGVGSAAFGRQDFGGAPVPDSAIRAASGIDASHALEEGGGVLASLFVGSGHGQCRAGRCQPLGQCTWTSSAAAGMARCT